MKSYVASHLKDMNRMTVYNLIASSDEISKADISRVTGISSPTVIKIVNFLLEKELVIEAGEGIAAIGRKPQMLRLNSNNMFAIGVIFEGDYIRAGIVNLSGKIIKSTITKVNPEFEEIVTGVLPQIIDKLIEETRIDGANIIGIGIGVPGLYDPEKRIISLAPLVNINEPLDIQWLVEGLAQRYGVPVIVGNDVNMDVMGEYRSLKLDNSDFIYISLGTGLGAGIILNGKLRVGCTYQCGEIGYMAFLDDYMGGRTNPGWLESRVNLRALSQRFDFDPYDTSKSDIDAIINYVSIPVSLCINNIVTFLDCDRITLGGVITESLGDRFINAVSAKVSKLSISDVKLQRQVSKDSGVVGASFEIIDSVISGILTEQT